VSFTRSVIESSGKPERVDHHTIDEAGKCRNASIGEGVLQVGQEIIAVLDPARQSDQAITDAQGGPPVGRD
jgi:hypothetical protein